MRANRPPSSAPALAASAEALPFDDGSFDAAMACITVHHWHPRAVGLAEMRRVTSGPADDGGASVVAAAVRRQR